MRIGKGLFKIVAICVSVCFFVNTIAYAVPNKKNACSILRANLLTDNISRKLDKERLKEALDKVSEWYFRPKSFEKSGRLYETLGVRVVNKIYLKTIGKLRSKLVLIMSGRDRYLDDHSDKSLRKLEKEKRILETIHIVYFILYSFVFSIFIFPAIPLLTLEKVLTVFIVLQLIANVYPIMLYRYVRTRIYKILEYRESKRKVQTIAKVDSQPQPTQRDSIIDNRVDVRLLPPKMAELLKEGSSLQTGL